MTNFSNENYERFVVVYDLPERSVSAINDALQNHPDSKVVSTQLLGNNQLLVVYQRELSNSKKNTNKKSSTLN